jgi:hypothetical protein
MPTGRATPAPPLAGEPIEVLPKPGVDPSGRLAPISDEEWRDRAASLRGALAEIDAGDDDPPGTFEQVMRGIDENRAPGRKLLDETF